MKEHKISLTTAILLNMNILIGSGILIGPGLMAAMAGNASFLTWPLVALIFLPLVLSIAALSRLFPGCGGFYTYVKEGLGETLGFMGGWLYVVGYTFAVGVEVLALRQTLLAAACTHPLIQNVMLFNVVCIAAIVLLNLMSFKLFSRFLNSLTITKILPLVILVVLLPFVFSPSFTVTGTEIQALPSALTFAMFGFFGFEYCCSLTHLIENSEKNAPRAVVMGFLATAALYTLFHFGVLQVMGKDNLAQWGAPAFAQFLSLGIPYIKTLLMLLIPVVSILTIFAAANGMMNSNGLTLQTMAPITVPHFAKVNRHGRPWLAFVIQGLVVFALITVLSDINLVGNLTNLGIFLGYFLPFVSLWALQQRRGASITAKLVTFLAMAITAGCCVYSWWRLGSSMSERCLYLIPLLIAIMVGFGLYKFRQSHAQRA